MGQYAWTELPIIDWELGRRLAGNQMDLAKDMLSALAQSLPAEHAEIKQLAIQRNKEELLRRIHKLHGAVAYCGTPRLKGVLSSLEQQLKRGEDENTSELMHSLDAEVHAVMQHNDLA